MDWKYNAGNLFSVAKLPAAIFNRPIPNIETNIKVVGITFEEVAVYFLPEKLLVIDGPQVGFVGYQALRVAVDQLEYVEPEGRLYGDSQVIGQRWKYINKDGSRDRRFKANYELPVVRCGIAALDVGRTRIQLLTSNPAVPPRFQEALAAVTTAGIDSGNEH